MEGRRAEDLAEAQEILSRVQLVNDAFADPNWSRDYSFEQLPRGDAMPVDAVLAWLNGLHYDPAVQWSVRLQPLSDWRSHVLEIAERYFLMEPALSGGDRRGGVVDSAYDGRRVDLARFLELLNAIAGDETIVSEINLDGSSGPFDTIADLTLFEIERDRVVLCFAAGA